MERPNNWAKSVKASEGLSDTKKLQLEFWEAFSNYAFAKKDFASIFKARKAQAQHWYTLSLGSSAYHLSLTVNTQKKRIGAEIYIDDDKELFAKFKESSKEIEAVFGSKLEWIEASKACRILGMTSGDIKKGTDAWSTMFNWFMEAAIKMRTISQLYDK